MQVAELESYPSPSNFPDSIARWLLMALAAVGALVFIGLPVEQPVPAFHPTFRAITAQLRGAVGDPLENAH